MAVYFRFRKALGVNVYYIYPGLVHQAQLKSMFAACYSLYLFKHLNLFSLSPSSFIQSVFCSKLPESPPQDDDGDQSEEIEF